MKEPEDILRAPARACPGQDHVRRMDSLFYSESQRSFLRRPVALWKCAAACMVCAACAVAAWRLVPKPSPPAKNQYTEHVYYIVSSPEAALPVPASAREGFLTDPAGVQVKVYSVRHEQAVESPGRI